MQRLLRLCVLWAAMATGLASFYPQHAQAEAFTFFMRNNTESDMEVEFYSRDRDAVWPGRGQIYPLYSYHTQNMRLNCEYGEKICYGAWQSGDRNGIYWGVGPGGRKGCSNCCYTCGDGATRVIGLDP